MYWHVPGKDDLLVLAADRTWEEIDLPDPVRNGWRPAAESMGRGLFAMLVGHPWLVTAMSTHSLYGPGKARFDDHLLGIFESAGWTPAEADLAAAAIVTSILGTALGASADAAWRTRLRKSGSDRDETRDILARIYTVTAPYPRLRARTRGSLDELTIAPDPGPGLAVVLDGLSALRGTTTGPERR